MPSVEERVSQIERKLAEWADLREIGELPARYCHAVVRGDGPGIAALFTEDGCMESDPILDRPATRMQGRAEMEKAYGDATASMQLRPFIHNHVIDLAGDRATGICSVEIRSVEHGVAYNGAGHYDDIYRRDDGVWKFERRRMTVYHWVPATESWA